MNLAEQRLIGGFGPEAMMDIELDLACALRASPHNHRGAINWSRAFPWLKPRLAELQGNVCCWHRHPIVEPTLEHIVPLSRGGKDAPDNLAIACRLCNHARGSMMPICMPVMPWHSHLLLEQVV